MEIDNNIEDKPKRRGGRPPTSVAKRQKVVSARYLGMTVEQCADYAGVTPTTARKILKDIGGMETVDETARFEFIQWLRYNEPMEWIKRHPHFKTAFESIDRMRIDQSVNINSEEAPKVKVQFVEPNPEAAERKLQEFRDRLGVNLDEVEGNDNGT